MDSQVETLLQSLSITPSDYTQVVTEHEAAHIVRGLSDGFRLKQVIIKPSAALTAKGGTVVGGSCDWDWGGAELDKSLNVSVAGPAWDDLVDGMSPCLRQLAKQVDETEFCDFQEYVKDHKLTIEEYKLRGLWAQVRTSVGDWFSEEKRGQQVQAIAAFLHKVLERGDREVPLQELKEEVRKIMGDDAAHFVGENP